MSKKRLLGILVIILLIVGVSIFYLSRRSTPSSLNSNNETFELSGPFAGPENQLISADAYALGRVLRGTFDSIPESIEPVFFISTQINWPEAEPLRTVPVGIQAQTEFLCWPESFTTGDGTEAKIKDTVYMLDDQHKLFLFGQRNLSREEAIGYLQKGTPVIVALQEPYTENRTNIAFQIAIVGCQQK